MARKQGFLLLAGLLLAGCGGSAAKPQAFVRLHGRGYSFVAPKGWKVARGPRSVAARDGAKLVSVTVFPLARRFRPALWARVQGELDAVARQLAAREHGRLRQVGTFSTFAGTDAHARQYVIEPAKGKDGHVQELLFVLRDRTEYQLLCVRDVGAERSACRRLIVSFELA